MKLYFAGYSTDKEIFEVEEAQYLLESYWNFKNKDWHQWHVDRQLMGRTLFLDSGAFSAHSQGITVDIDKYIRYIHDYKDDIQLYANLDVIGDYQGTRTNQEQMEASGLNPLPTFHFGSPKEELERMLEKYDYIALGGLVPYAMQRKVLQQWLDSCFAIIKTRAKVHGFGVNALWAWLRYPWYSVDSTSWLMGGKFRRLIEFKNGEFITATKRAGKGTVGRYKTINADYKDLNRQNVLAYLEAKDYVTKVWEERGVKWD